MRSPGIYSLYWARAQLVLCIPHAYHEVHKYSVGIDGYPMDDDYSLTHRE